MTKAKLISKYRAEKILSEKFHLPFFNIDLVPFTFPMDKNEFGDVVEYVRETIKEYIASVQKDDLPF